MIDFTKPVETRSGMPARIICTDKKGLFSVVSLVGCGDSESMMEYTPEGRSASVSTDYDLVNVPVVRTTYSSVTIDGKVGTEAPSVSVPIYDTDFKKVGFIKRVYHDDHLVRLTFIPSVNFKNET